MKSTRGFTLIELLVVIAIIGILASVVMASLNSARTNARNTRRLADTAQLVNAFNLSLNSASSMPSSGGTYTCVSATCYDGWSGYTTNSAVETFLASSLPSKPSDPVGGSRGYGGYLYHSAYGGSVLYDGSTFPVGPVLMWLVEPPMKTGICGNAHIDSVGAGYISCVLPIGR